MTEASANSLVNEIMGGWTTFTFAMSCMYTSIQRREWDTFHIFSFSSNLSVFPLFEKASMLWRFVAPVSDEVSLEKPSSSHEALQQQNEQIPAEYELLHRRGIRCFLSAASLLSEQTLVPLQLWSPSVVSSLFFSLFNVSLWSVISAPSPNDSVLLSLAWRLSLNHYHQ